MPAALFWWLLAGAALHQRPPVGDAVIHLDLQLLEQIDQHLAGRRLHRLVGRRQHHHRLPLVAGLPQLAAGPGEVAWPGDRGHVDIGRQRCAGGKDTDAGAPHLRLPGHRGHDIGLAHRAQHGAAHRRLIEGWVERVEDPSADGAEGVGPAHHHIAGAFERGGEIVRRVLPPLHLAIAQRRGGGAAIGHDDPFDAVEEDPLRPGGPAGLAVRARDVVRVAGIGHAGAADALIGQEAEGAAADMLLDLGVGVGRGHPFGHDEQRGGAKLAQRVQHRPEGRFQADGEDPILG